MKLIKSIFLILAFIAMIPWTPLAAFIIWQNEKRGRFPMTYWEAVKSLYEVLFFSTIQDIWRRK